MLLCIGFGLTIAGAVFLCTWDRIYRFVLKEKLALSPHSTTFESWKESKFPVSMDIYLFNCTNPHQMTEEDFKPDLVQLGPYRFFEESKKMHVTWNSNHTVTFQIVRHYHYDRDNSNGSLHDNFTTLDSAALTASHKTRYWSYFSALSASTAIRFFGKSVWITKSVGEFLIDGYTDPLLTMSNLLSSSNSKFSSDKIGLIYQRNGSIAFDGVTNINTGEDDLNKMGNINYHNYVNQTENFEEDCGHVTGSLGDFFGAMPIRKRRLDVFIPRLCRSVPLEYSEDVTVYGITGYRYVTSERLMDNGTIDPSTQCNCGGECLPQGVINTTECMLSSPSYVSYPHFLDADPIYRHQVKGMKPDPDIHRFYITVEPTTGIILDVRIPMQFNMLLKPNLNIGVFRTVPTRMVPILWFVKSFTIDPEAAKYMCLVIRLQVIGHYFFAGIALLGIVLMVCPFLLRILAYKQAHLKESRRPSDGQNSSNEQDKCDKKLEISSVASTSL